MDHVLDRIDVYESLCGVPTQTFGSPEYLKLLEEVKQLHIRKSKDYGVTGGDPLANCRGSERLGVPAWKGTFIRALDKVQRVESYCINGRLENESLEDSLMDLAAYSLIALVLFRETTSKSVAG